MTNIPDPSEVLTNIMQAAHAAGAAENMPPVGAFTAEYAEKISENINTENVEAFIQGAAVANLIVQEVMHRIAMVAAETGAEAVANGDDGGATYSMGVHDGVAHVSQMYGTLIEQITASVVEGPLIDSRFNEIVANF